MKQLGHQVRRTAQEPMDVPSEREPVGRRLGHVGRANGARGPALLSTMTPGQGCTQFEGDVAAQHVGAATMGSAPPGDELRPQANRFALMQAARVPAKARVVSKSAAL